MKNWSSEEIRIIRTKCATASTYAELLPLLPGRTINELRCKARGLGIKHGNVGRQKRLPLSISHAAYLAGLIDGEGTIAVNLYHAQSRKRGPQIMARVSIFNTDASLLAWVSQTTGLSSSSRRRKNPSKNSKMIFDWSIRSTADVSRFLRSILPYLQIKRRQAILTLEFCEHRILYSPMNPREKEIVELMRELNRRGTAQVIPPPTPG